MNLLDVFAINGCRFLDAAKVAQPLLDLLLRVVGRACRIVLDQLVALLCRRRGDVARLACLIGSLGGPGFRVGVLARLDIAHLEAGNHGRREFLCRTHKSLRLAGSLRQGVGFGRHKPGAHFVVDGNICGAINGLRRGEFSKLLKHALIGERVDSLPGRRRHSQLTHQFVARREKRVSVFIDD